MMEIRIFINEKKRKIDGEEENGKERKVGKMVDGIIEK